MAYTSAGGYSTGKGSGARPSNPPGGYSTRPQPMQPQQPMYPVQNGGYNMPGMPDAGGFAGNHPGAIAALVGAFLGKGLTIQNPDAIKGLLQVEGARRLSVDPNDMWGQVMIAGAPQVDSLLGATLGAVPSLSYSVATAKIDEDGKLSITGTLGIADKVLKTAVITLQSVEIGGRFLDGSKVVGTLAAGAAFSLSSDEDEVADIQTALEAGDFSIRLSFLIGAAPVITPTNGFKCTVEAAA